MTPFPPHPFLQDMIRHNFEESELQTIDINLEFVLTTLEILMDEVDLTQPMVSSVNESLRILIKLRKRLTNEA